MCKTMCAGGLVWSVDIAASMPPLPKPFLVAESETKNRLGRLWNYADSGGPTAHFPKPIWSRSPRPKLASGIMAPEGPFLIKLLLKAWKRPPFPKLILVSDSVTKMASETEQLDHQNLHNFMTP